jgi:hypothetical protein
MHQVNVQWDKVRTVKEAETPRLLRELYKVATSHPMKETLKILKDFLKAARDYDKKFERSLKDASSFSMNNIDKSIAKGEVALERAKVVRDVSAEIIICGTESLAGPVAGGAAGAIIKGAIKWQDSDYKISKAVFAEAGVEAVVGVVGGKIKAAGAAKKITGAEELGLNIIVAKVKGGLDVPKAYLEGKTVEAGVKSGVFKASTATGQELTKDFLTKWVGSSEKAKLLAIPVLAGINYAVDTKASKVAEPPKPDPPKVPPDGPQQNILDSMTMGDKYIENCVEQISSKKPK